MKQLKFDVAIAAPAEKVFHLMLAPESYQEWVAAFEPGSYFEGSWNKGEKIRFIGVDQDGRKQGMVARIAENIPGKFISIQHVGVVSDGAEITEGPAVNGWAGAFENYAFEEQNGVTKVEVEVDTKDEYVEYFSETWPVALAKLKEVCER